MKATLLGTGDSHGQPVPLCDCGYCLNCEERLRTSLLVETNDITLLFDATPDIRKQVHHENVYQLDAVYITHHHFDHSSGIEELNHICSTRTMHNPDEFDHPTHGKDIPMYCPPDSRLVFQREKNYLLDSVEIDDMAPTEEHQFQSLRVSAIPVTHGIGRTYGYKITDSTTGEELIYAPDMAGWETDPDQFGDVEALVFEGSGILGPETHATTEQIETALEAVAPDEVYLVNVSEHTAECSTEKLREEAQPYNVVSDFTQVL